MLPLPHLLVKWVVPDQNSMKTKETSSLDQFQTITEEIRARFDNKIIPFLREGDKYYHLIRHAPKLHKLFHLTQQAQSTGESNWKVREVLIQFKYSPQHQHNQMFKKMEASLQNTSRQLTDKIAKAQSESYYNNIRIEKKKSFLKSDTHMKKLKIWFLISEPLVKVVQNEGGILGSLKEEIKIHEHKQLIKELHDSQNYSINLSMERIYISWERLCRFVEKLKQNQSQFNENSQHRQELNILHIYTQIYMEGTQFYVSLQTDFEIGGESRNVKLGRFIEKLNEVPNLYTIILIGQNMRMLKINDIEKKKKKKKNEQEQLEELGLKKMTSNIFRSNFRSEVKQWHKMTNVPIVTVGVYDVEKDLMRKHFMRHFYSNLFRRKSILDCFESTKKKIKQLSGASHQNITNCCCMHPQQNQPMWGKLVNAIGNSTIHKIFKHGDTTSLKDNLQNNPEMFKGLIGFILGLSEEDKARKNLFRCVNVVHNAYRQIQDILLFNNKFDGDYLPIPAQKEHWEAGQLIFDEIRPVKNSRYRPLIIYQILQQIIHSPRFHVLAITGSSKSGKSLFIELVEGYLSSRNSAYICQHFREWLKHYRSGQYKEIIHNLLREAQRNSRLADQDALFQNQPKLILILGKINYEIKQEFEKFIKSVSEVEKIKQGNIIMLAAISETSEIRNKEIQVYKIPPITDLETKYFILRDESIQLKFENHVIILKQIMEAFQGREGENIKNEIQFSNFCKELNRMIESIYSLRKKPEEREERKKIISEEIQKYINKTNTILDCMRIEQSETWEDIGFLCSFKECFYLCDFNERMALSKKGLIEQITLSEGQKNYFFRIFQQCKYSNKQEKSILIQPELKCHQYFLSFLPHFFKRKVKYFFNFYYFSYTLIKKNPSDKQRENYGRIFDNMGIFMYEYQTRLQQIVSDEGTKQRLGAVGQTQKQRQYIYEVVLQRHIYTYIEFLRQTNTNVESLMGEGAQKQQLLFLVVYSILLASICHKFLDAVLGQKKKELNQEIQRFTRLSKHTKNSQIQILLAQIGSLVGADEHQSGHPNPNNQIQKEQWAQANILNALREYELVKQSYECEMQRLSKGDVRGQQLHETVVRMLRKIQQSIRNLKVSIHSERLDEIKKQKHFECILDLILAKIMIRYHHYNEEDDNIEEINLFTLREQLAEIEAHIPRTQYKDDIKYTYSDQIIQVCSLYLKLKINIHLCKDSDIKTQTSSLPHRYWGIHNYLKQKLNPKTLFKSGNVALFMKAGCFKVNEQNYNFVRINNMISSFLTRKLSSRNINLLFLNLSVKNFEMLAEEAPHIHYFVLSTDCILNRKNNLQVIFEDTQTISAKLIDIKTFGTWLRKIKTKFLILVGSKSGELYKQIAEWLNKENICVISLTLNRTSPDLSTYPEIIGEYPQQTIEVVKSFIKAENSRRMIEMTICCLITLLVQEKDIYVTQQNMVKLIEESIELSKKILRRWYQNKPNISDFLHQISYEVHVQDHQTEFPQIPLGELKNLTSQMTVTPYNFKDDAYYQNIGRASCLEEIMKILAGGKGTIIEIAGGKRSGKTELLKEVGWFCQTRSIFQLGVYRYDIKQLLDKNNLEQILNHLHLESLSKQYLLILLDNLEPGFISSHVPIFSDFFLALETKPVSLIYTIQHEPSQQQISPNQYYLVNGLLESYLRESTKKYQLHSFDINRVDEVQKICIALVNLRRRNTPDYSEFFQTYFNTLCDFRMKPVKQKERSKGKGQNEPKLRKKGQKISQMKRIKSDQASLESDFQNLSQKLMKNKSSYIHQPLRREVSLESDDFSDDFSEENCRDFEEIRQKQEQNISEEGGSSIRRINTSVSSSPTKIKSMSSDLNSILQVCEGYKKREEKGQQMYEQNYIRYDIEQLMQELLDQQCGVQIIVENSMFFPRFDIYSE